MAGEARARLGKEDAKQRATSKKQRPRSDLVEY